MAFDFGNILGNPFYIGSLGLVFIGWFILFVSTCIGSVAVYPVQWWYVFYELFFNAAVTVVLATDSMRHYRVMIIGFLAISITQLTSQLTYNVNSIWSSLQAAAAGGIFILIVHFTWMIVFGSSDDSAIAQLVGGWSVMGKSAQQQQPISQPGSGQFQPGYAAPQAIQMGPVGVPMGAGNIPDIGNTVVVSPNAQYAYKAHALYAYDANVEDPNELSFVKGETLEIVDNKGKWWQARKANGQVGIAPSNYLQII